MSDFSIIGGSGVKSETSPDSGASSGLPVAPNSTAHVKGLYVEIVASTGFDYGNILLFLANRDIAPNLLDIAVGSAGNEVIVLKDILLDKVTNTLRFQCDSLLLPVGIPKGTRITARVQTGSASGIGPRVLITGIGRSLSESSPMSLSIAEGVDTANTKGVVVDPGSSAHTKGSYIEITGSSNRDYKGFFLSLGLESNSSPTSGHYLLDIAIGSVGNEEVILSNYWRTSDTGDVYANTLSPFLPIGIPKGTRISARAQSGVTNATDRVFSVTLNGIT